MGPGSLVLIPLLTQALSAPPPVLLPCPRSDNPCISAATYAGSELTFWEYKVRGA